MKRVAAVQSKRKLNYHMGFYLLAILFIGFTSTLRGTDLLAAFFILISLATMAMWLFKYRSRTLTIILFTAFVSRLLLAITQSFIMPLPDSNVDAVVFERLGWDVASAWNSGTPPPGTPGAFLYSKFIALVYYTAGHTPFLIQYINVILGVLTVYIVYKTIITISMRHRGRFSSVADVKGDGSCDNIQQGECPSSVAKVNEDVEQWRTVFEDKRTVLSDVELHGKTSNSVTRTVPSDIDGQTEGPSPCLRETVSENRPLTRVDTNVKGDGSCDNIQQGDNPLSAVKASEDVGQAGTVSADTRTVLSDIARQMETSNSVTRTVPSDNVPSDIDGQTEESSLCLGGTVSENRPLTRVDMPAVIGALIAALYPTLNLYSAITVRENIITFFSLFSVYCFLKWVKNGSMKEIVKSFVLLVVAGALHGAVILIGGVFAFFFCFYRPKLKKWGFVNKQTVLLVLGIIVVFGLFKSVLLNKIPSDITLLLSPEYLKSRVEPLAVGRGAYLVGFYPASVLDIFLQTPVRIIYFLFSPFPWKIAGLADFIGFIDAFMYAILIVYSFKGFRKLNKYGKLMYLAILFIALVEVVTFAWGTSNYGTAVRHRQKIICFLIAAASFGMAGSREVKAGNGQ